MFLKCWYVLVKAKQSFNEHLQLCTVKRKKRIWICKKKKKKLFADVIRSVPTNHCVLALYFSSSKEQLIPLDYCQQKGPYLLRWGKAAFRRLRRNSWMKTTLLSTVMFGPRATVILPISNRLNMYARMVACIVKPTENTIQHILKILNNSKYTNLQNFSSVVT